ncbi:MAG: formylglycine-generating enzyme family protein [Gammaproteobacteria bacterium]|jgi:formylglycine-generating enzyme required for sulfatase activity
MTQQRTSGLHIVIPVAVVIAVAVILVMVPDLRRENTSASNPGEITNSIGMKLMAIPGGSFLMGGDPKDDIADELPPHTVKVAPFYLGKYEVTQAQWQAVMGENPSTYKHPLRPVDQVTWLEVQAFIDKLNRMEGTSLYRLPSEAEWEYAARAGTTTKWFFGDDKQSLGRYAWFGQHGDDIGTRPVGHGEPNPWGLYDMYGNVWEWVADCWHDNYQNAPQDGSVWSGGDCSRRIVRGGAWNSPALYARSAVRGSSPPQMNDPSNGFRLARSR